MPRWPYHRERKFAADPRVLGKVSSSSFPARPKSCCPDSSRSTLRSVDFQTFSIRANRSNTVPPVRGVQYRPVFSLFLATHSFTDTYNPLTTAASEQTGESGRPTDRPVRPRRPTNGREGEAGVPGSPSGTAVSRHLTAARSRPAGSGGLSPDPERASARGRPRADRHRRRRCGCEVVAG